VYGACVCLCSGWGLARGAVYKLQAEAAVAGATPAVAKECEICYEDFVTGQEIATLNCLCQYHRPCIDAWLTRGRHGCPTHAPTL
jgi:hypothetical protein